MAAAKAQAFWTGFKIATPLWLSVFPVAMTFGAASRDAGLTSLETIVMAAFVFTGTAQLATVTLIGQQAGLLVILATSLLVNLRYIPMAASLAPPLRQEKWYARVLGGLALTDESYASSVREVRDQGASIHWLFGAGASIYICWVGASAVGMVASQSVSIVALLSLAIIFPLFCAAIVGRMCASPMAWTACGVGGACVVLSSAWFHPGVAILIGMLAGAAVALAWKDPP